MSQDTAFQRASLALRMHGYDENTEPDEIVRVVLGAMLQASPEMIRAGVASLEDEASWGLTEEGEAEFIWSVMMKAALK